MPDRHPRPRHAGFLPSIAPIRGAMFALMLSVVVVSPALAADPTPTPTASPTPIATPTPIANADSDAGPDERAGRHRDTDAYSDGDADRDHVAEWRESTRRAHEQGPREVTINASGAAVPWRYAVAVRGTTVATGSTSNASVAVTVTNNCSITTQSVTSTVTDARGRTAGTAATLDRSLCPPPPNVPHAADRILAGPTLTETSFVDWLRAVGSPALSEGRSIYRTSSPVA